MREADELCHHSSEEARRRIQNSTVFLHDLLTGAVSREDIEVAFSSDGCGAVLVELDEGWNAFYESYYYLQWQLGHRVFADRDVMNRLVSEFALMDLPLRLLLCRCGVAVARSRKGIEGATTFSADALGQFDCASPLAFYIGRPLAANRSEFHPSVDWLIEQEQSNAIEVDGDPTISVVGYSATGHEIVGRSRADEARLVALYREWQNARPQDRQGHGNKFNGDIYYGAFRGRVHIDRGGTLTTLFGPGELRNRVGGAPEDNTVNCKLGGTLLLAAPGERTLTSLPPRLPTGSAYVVVFFEQVASPSLGLETFPAASSLGWSPTSHGVQRIFETRFSRGQAIQHVKLSSAHLSD